MEKEQEDVQGQEPVQDEIDREQAIALPKREAMTVLAPPLISPLIKGATGDPPPADTGQGIDESDPGSGA